MPGLFRSGTSEGPPPPVPSGYPVIDTTFGSPRNPGVAWEANEFTRRCGVLMQSFDATSVQLMANLGLGGSRTQRGSIQDNQSAIATLKEAGVKFMVHPGVYNQKSGAMPATVQQMLATVKAVGPDAFLAVFNVNEPDNVDSKANNLTTYWQFLRNYQQELYETFKADPETKHMLVGGPGWSFLRYESAVGMGNIDPWIDCHEVHTYPRAGRAPERADIFRVIEFIFDNNLGSRQKPVFVGEMGWHTSPDNWGTDDPVAKKDQMMPRHYLYHFDHGVALSNNFMHTNTTAGTGWEGGDPASYGWVKASGLTQPSYETCKRLFSMLADPGPRHNTADLAYSLTGNTQDVHHVLFQKRNGTYYLAIWVGLYLDQNRAVTVNIPAGFSSLRMARPNFSSSWESWPLGTGSFALTADGYVTLFELH